MASKGRTLSGVMAALAQNIQIASLKALLRQQRPALDKTLDVLVDKMADNAGENREACTVALVMALSEKNNPLMDRMALAVAVGRLADAKRPTEAPEGQR